MIAHYTIHGHAIVSADDRIADADGSIPPSLHNEADWQRFQTALDQALVTVLGRLGHESHPNLKKRNRLVVSSRSKGLERRDDAWWWNPAEVPIVDALAQAAPEPGVVAVPGGRLVFDLFLAEGFDAFFLSRARRAKLPSGRPIFSAVAHGRSASDVLTDHGLRPEPAVSLDEGAGVELVVWRALGRAGSQKTY